MSCTSSTWSYNKTFVIYLSSYPFGNSPEIIEPRIHSINDWLWDKKHVSYVSVNWLTSLFHDYE